MHHESRRFAAPKRVCCSLACSLLIGFFGIGTVQAAADAMPIYSAPPVEDVQSATLQWVARVPVRDEAALNAIGTLWSDSAVLEPTDVLDAVIATFAIADADVRRFVGRCDLADGPLIPAPLDPLLERYESDFFRANLTLYYGRYLTQRRMYDEALELLSRLDPQSVIDPASCLFYLAVCQHQLLMKDEGLATLTRLLENTEQVPVAYATVAELMKYEMESLKPKSLEEITRMMSDVERRLDVGQGGQKVQKREQEIVALLDEMIEKMEQSGGGGGGAASGNQPTAPAGDSNVGGATGPGEVDRKDIGDDNGWGALPAKEEARAKQLIDRNFPPHYREAIEEYNKKLSKRRAQPGQ